MTDFSNLSQGQLRSLRKALEAQGSSGATNPVHDALNKAYSASFSDEELWDAKASRDDGAPQATAELRRRGYNV